MKNLVEMLEHLKALYELFKLYKRLKGLRSIKRRRRWWVRPVNVERNRFGYFETCFKQLKLRDSEEFFKHTRMFRAIYDLLLNLVDSYLRKRSKRAAIEPECRLAITLSYLSQGVSPQFLAWSYKMGRTTVRNIILETCETIWSNLSVVYVSKPTEIDYIQIAEQYDLKWNMPNCVGAIDGKHINIQCPPQSGSAYYNYKKSFSIVLLAVCDANYIFTDVCIGGYGSSSDGGILRHSQFGKELLNKQLPLPGKKKLTNSNIDFPHYFVGDAAFPLKENIMRPFPGKLLVKPKEIFNYRQPARARRVIENAFGILVARWRVLRQDINLLPANAEKVVLATIALHNFIKLNDTKNIYCSPNYVDWEDEAHTLHPGEWREEVNSSRNSIRLSSNNAIRDAFHLRNILKNYFMNEGSVPFQYR